MDRNMRRRAKICLIGEAGVGKSQIMLRFVANDFQANSESTIGAAFGSKALVVDDQDITFAIWDTGGQEKYRSLAALYYHGAAAAIVVYDITRACSFKKLQSWVQELQSSGQENIRGRRYCAPSTPRPCWWRSDFPWLQ
jgi:small GTP-binding protein